MHNVRNTIPGIYALLILAGFLISATVGVIVIIAGGALSGMLWSSLSRGRSPSTGQTGGRRSDRANARAMRRAGRR